MAELITCRVLYTAETLEYDDECEVTRISPDSAEPSTDKRMNLSDWFDEELSCLGQEGLLEACGLLAKLRREGIDRTFNVQISMTQHGRGEDADVEFAVEGKEHAHTEETQEK